MHIRINTCMYNKKNLTKPWILPCVFPRPGGSRSKYHVHFLMYLCQNVAGAWCQHVYRILVVLSSSGMCVYDDLQLCMADILWAICQVVKTAPHIFMFACKSFTWSMPCLLMHIDTATAASVFTSIMMFYSGIRWLQVCFSMICWQLQRLACRFLVKVRGVLNGTTATDVTGSE